MTKVGIVPEHIKAVALDFDGVLADTNKAHTLARQEAFANLGYDVSQAVHDEAHRHGSHASQIIGWILAHQGVIRPDSDVLADPVVARVVHEKERIYFAQAASGLDAVTGAIDYLRYAGDRYGRAKVAIATTATQEFEVLPFLRRYEVEGLVGHIVAKENTPPARMKPDPFVYDQAAELIGVASSDIVAVEDSPRGVTAAQAAGLLVVGITTTHTRGDLQAADMVVDSFAELMS